MPTILKLGGELLDEPVLRATAAAVAALARTQPLVVVHGGGRAIDAELRARGVEPNFVDGLRVTDAEVLDAVISVLAGRNNTALVAALFSEGCRAVGLTGADAGLGLSALSGAFTSAAGHRVDLGLVGRPANGSAALLTDLLRLRYVPVIASVGVTSAGELLNVNADTFAGHLAGAIGASRLIIAGATPGVLDAEGRSIPTLKLERIDAMIAAGEAHSGMIAKLAACRAAVVRGVADVSIVTGLGVIDFDHAPGTHIAAEQTV